jgi:hypothetical protein
MKPKIGILSYSGKRRNNIKNVGLYDCAAMRVTALQLSIRRMANWLIEQAFGLGGETVASAY